MRKIKKINVADLYSLLSGIIRDDSMLALGGTTIHMNPMGLLRILAQLAYKDMDRIKEVPGIKGLDVVAGPLAGPAVDFLCGTGIASRVRASYVAAEYLGLLQRFTKKVCEGAVEVWECGETIFIQGLRAAAEGIDFGITKEGVGTDILKLNKDLKQFDPPIGNGKTVAVPPILPDACFLHVPMSDVYGNCSHIGPIYSDLLLASATKRNGGIVIVSCEEIALPSENGKLGSDCNEVTIPASLVDHVVEIKYGAHPTSCHERYLFDEAALRVYISAGKTDESFMEWLKDNVLESKNEKYISKLNPDAFQTGSGEKNNKVEEYYTDAELLAVRLSECIHNEEFGSAGANSPIPQAAMRLAQLTHSPDMTYISSHSGYISRFRPTDDNGEIACPGKDLTMLREPLHWSSFDSRNRATAECALASPDIFLLKRDFFFVSGLQFDRCGNVNLIGIGDQGALKIRGPGSAGVALVSAMASRLYLYTPFHARRTIVEKVDFISGIGHPAGRQKRKALGLPGAGPTLLITPLCTFDFNDDGMLRLKSLNPGRTVENVLENTGAEVDVPESEVPVSPAPGPEELYILRNLIDPNGILGKVKTS